MQKPRSLGLGSLGLWLAASLGALTTGCVSAPRGGALDGTVTNVPSGISLPAELGSVFPTNHPAIWLEAESPSAPAREQLKRFHRSCASGRMTLHLGEFVGSNEKVISSHDEAGWSFGVAVAGDYDIYVLYSDDGGNDEVVGSFDGRESFRCRTRDTRQPGARPGSGWNEFVWAKVGTVPLARKEHTLHLQSRATSYGVDLDAILLVGRTPVTAPAVR